MNPMMRCVVLAVVVWSAAAGGAAEPGRLSTDIEYGVAGGESLKLDAYVPDGPGPFAAVILVHGGGWSTGDKSGGPRKLFIAPMHAPLERKGLAWFSINYRLGPKHRYPACIEDVETAIRWVKANAASYRVDPKRIGLAGESAGGHLVALAAVRADEATQVAAVVPFYAPFDLVRMAEQEKELRAGFKALIGRETADAVAMQVLREVSPSGKVRRGLPPFLLLHGTADKRVPFEQSELFLAELRAAGVAAELHVVEGGDHGMGLWETFSPGYGDRVAAWLWRALEGKGKR